MTTPTPETPAELAAKARAYLLPYRHAPQHMLTELRDEFHAVIDRLERLATLAASSTAPAGFVLVPVEPTEAMQEAGHVGIGQPPGVARSIYRAMLAAAPAAAERKPLTDEQIESLAVEHEAFGFGRADHRSDISVHGFEPDGLRSFARAIERAHGITGDSHE